MENVNKSRPREEKRLTQQCLSRSQKNQLNIFTNRKTGDFSQFSLRTSFPHVVPGESPRTLCEGNILSCRQGREVRKSPCSDANHSHEQRFSKGLKPMSLKSQDYSRGFFVWFPPPINSGPMAASPGVFLALLRPLLPRCFSRS